MIPQLQRETPVASPETTPQWSLAARTGFRFIFSYFVIYLGPGAVGALGVRDQGSSNPYRGLWASIWHNVVPWVGTNVLHLKGDFREVLNGSGDELYDYVLVFCVFVLAIVVTAVWSWLDRKRLNYERLHAWLRMGMRLAVAGPMIGYGVAKLFQAQFPEPPLARLIDPLGQMSPMGLLWTFMGLSRAYSFFGGFGEVLAGVLLLVPRLTALGSLVMLGVMGNVLMLNLCYDVPRKIFSIHLILIGTFLLLPDLRRLANVFIFNRTAEPVREAPLFDSKGWNTVALYSQLAFGVFLIAMAYSQARFDEVRAARHLGPALRGVWFVDEFTLDNVPHLALVTDQQRWHNVVFDGPTLLSIQMMDGTLQQYNLRLDEAHNNLTFSELGGTHRKATLSFDNSQPDRMTMTGELDDRPITAHLRKWDMSDPNKFLLLNRGFHWVNPYAYRR